MRLDISYCTEYDESLGTHCSKCGHRFLVSELMILIPVDNELGCKLVCEDCEN